MTGKGVLAPASGQQFEIELGAERAVVCEVGATLRSYVVNGVEVLDGFPAHDRSNSGRGQVLAPWPNRLEDGRYTFVGREGQAAWDEPERRNAIHGLVRWLPWQVVERTDRTVELACLLPPQPAYPWRLGLRMHYELTPAGLEVTATASNESDAPAPFGIGFHPYLTLSGTIDDLVLLVPARRTLLSDARALPTGDESVAGTDRDFTAARTLGALQLDTAFTDLVPDVDGVTRVRLATAQHSRSATVWMDGTFTHVMVYTGDTLEPEERRRQGIAIEPMTCPPNAFRSGVDVIRLEPGRSWRGRWGISVEEGS